MNARLLCVLLIATGLSPGLVAQQYDQDIFAKTADLPGWHITLWEEVIHYDHPYFAQWSAPLGDISGDGYDDFAIATETDTTFIFYGGDPLDHEPAYSLYGGGAGINVGDFNGDGLPDLVTARVCQRPGLPCPENRGQIRLFYGRQSGRTFGPEPDLVIEGGPDEGTGAFMDAHLRPTVQVLDFNGDGYDDFVTPTRDWADSIDQKAVMYLGSENMDAVVDLEFTSAPPTNTSDSYVRDMLTGDLNGDGFDDLLILGASVVDAARNPYWRLYLGSKNPRTAEPDRVLQRFGGWAPTMSMSAIMDVDADGYADIIDAGKHSIHRERGDVLVFRGGPVLPEIILPNDSIPNYNPDPLAYQWPQIASPVGDMNGDGTPDLMIAWRTYFYPGSSAYFFHPGGPLFREPTGYAGTVPDQDYVVAGLYDAGDVNGDGYDDALALGQGGTPENKRNRFQLRLGSGKLSTAVSAVPVATDARLTLSPNPLPAGTARLHIRGAGLERGIAQLILRDLLGRTLQTVSVDVQDDVLFAALSTGTLGRGMYIVTLRQGTALLHGKIIVE